MSEVLDSILSVKAWDRLPRMLSLLEAGSDLSEVELEAALSSMPSQHRLIARRGLLCDYSAPLAVPPPSQIRYTGPLGHLLDMPEGLRADELIRHAPDYEDHVAAAPELLLLVPSDRRSEVEAAVLGTGVLSTRTASSGSSGTWRDDSGEEWPYTSQEALSSEQLLKLLDGLPPIYLDESSRLEVLQALPSVSVSYRDSSGKRADVSSELFQPWDEKWAPHAFHDGQSLRLWDNGTLLTIPFKSIMHASVTVRGRTSDVLIGSSRKKPTAAAAPIKAQPVRQNRLSAKSIYSYLSNDSLVAKIEVGDGQGSYTIYARSFPDGTEDAAGHKHKFGEHPDSDVLVLWDNIRSKLIALPVDSLKSVSYSRENSVPGLRMENEAEGDTTANKNTADVEYLKEYLDSMSKLHSKVSGKVIGVADLETVGLLGKNYEDADDKSHGQILQVAGVKVKGDMSGLSDTGDTLNLKARLSPHNQRILHTEVKNGFQGKLVDPDSHSDILSHNLAYVHREHMSFEDTDIFGLPLSIRYMTKRGKTGAKEYKMPKRLSEADYSEMMKTEARLPTEEEVLVGVNNWLSGTGGYQGKVDVLCGHNLYSFDKHYLNARLKRYGMPQLPNIPCLDTLHLAGIMFLPALSALAFIPSVAPETGEEIVPADVKEQAKELVSSLKSGLNLSSLTKALGIGLDDAAHDALADTMATARVLESMLMWLESKQQYLLKHAHYDRLRRGAWENYAKGFRNKFRKRKA